MTWPWSRARKRAADATYTDAVVRQLLAAATGQAADTVALGVVQAAAGLLGRVLGAATVTPASGRTAPLTAQWLREAGRDLVLRGEAVFRIRVSANGVVLDRAASWTVEGRREWRYRLVIPAPSATVATGLLSADQVIHLRYHSEASMPWRGVSPAQAASLTGSVAARIEAMLARESGGPSGYLIADQAGGAAPPNLANLKGGTAIVPTQQPFRGAPAAGQNPRRDWQAERFGFNQPATTQGLRWDAQRALLAAHSIPSALFFATAGSDRRAAWAEYVTSEGRAVADSVAAELATKLDEPRLAIDVSGLIPREPLAQARMVNQLVSAGMDVEQARELAGL